MVRFGDIGMDVFVESEEVFSGRIGETPQSGCGRLI